MRSQAWSGAFPPVSTGGNIPSSGGGDPHWANVVLLMDMAGADAGTSFLDTSSYARTLTGANGAVTSTAFAEYGTTSGRFNANLHQVTAAHASELTPSATDFTIEFSIYLVATNTFGRQVMLKNVAAGGLAYFLSFGNSTSTISWVGRDGAGVTNCTLDTGNIAVGSWVKIAISAVNGAIAAYVGGTRVDTDTILAAFGGTSGTWLIGSQQNNVDLAPNYYLDNIRITKSVGRYSGLSYTPATAAFPVG